MEIVESNNPYEIKFFKLIAYGLFATFISSAVWAAFTIWSGWELGFIGIGSAYIVCKSILYASKQIKNRKIQVLAIVFTLVSISIANLIILFYFSLKQNGQQSHLLIGLLGLILSPQDWGSFLLAVVESQDPISWLINVITILTAYRLTNPKIVISQNPSVPPKSDISDQHPNLDKHINRKITAFTALYILCILISIFTIFIQTMSSLSKAIVFVILILISGYVIRKTRILRQNQQEQLAFAQHSEEKA